MSDKSLEDLLAEDLLHVYDNWVTPKLSRRRMEALADRGWINRTYDSGLETDIWEVTGEGWKALEDLKMVPKVHGGE